MTKTLGGATSVGVFGRRQHRGLPRARARLAWHLDRIDPNGPEFILA